MSEPNGEPAAPDVPAAGEGAGRSKNEKLFLGGLVVSTLILAAIFIAVAAIYSVRIPAMFIAILIAISVATLVYAFLGGSGGDSFSVRGMKLAGAAAVFGVVVFIVNGSLNDQMRAEDAGLIETGRKAEALIQDQKAIANAERGKREEAEAKLKRRTKADDRDIEAEIKETTAADELGRQILAIQARKEGPWRKDIDTEDVSGRFNGRVADGSFQYCHSKHPRFAGNRVRFKVQLADDVGASDDEISLVPGGDIGPDCTRQRLSYSVKLGCDAARMLIPKLIEGCSAEQGLLWKEGASRSELKLYATIETGTPQ